MREPGRASKHHRLGVGAQNVAIAVGGVPAQVVDAKGHSATFIVPAGVQLGPSSVIATNPGGHTGSIAFKVCDLLMPDNHWLLLTGSRFM